MTSLILKRAPVGDNPEDYSVLENGVVVGRIFLVPVAPQGRPWRWASGHSADSIKRAAHGYETTREAAMGAFAGSWRCAFQKVTIPNMTDKPDKQDWTTIGPYMASASRLPSTTLDLTRIDDADYLANLNEEQLAEYRRFYSELLSRYGFC